MAILGIEEYIIDFAVLEDNNPKTITLFDKSNYLFTPEKPMIDIIMPGYTGVVEFAYTTGGLITITSNDLKVTLGCTFNTLKELPDGVYQIKMKVCPYDELFKKICYLRTTRFQCQYEEMLLSLDVACSCMEERRLKEEIIDIDILIQSAKAEAKICNVEKATSKYKAAVRKLNNLTKKISCN
jgi:hypothetical protein